MLEINIRRHERILPEVKLLYQANNLAGIQRL